MPFQEYVTGADSKQIEIADIDGDGAPDLYTGRNILLGDGAGGFNAPVTISLPVGWTSYRFVHLNDDIYPDLVYVTEELLGVQLTSGTCVFCGGVANLTVPANIQINSSIAVGDLDNDSDLDVVVNSFLNVYDPYEVTQTKVSTFYNDGVNNYSTAAEQSVRTSGNKQTVTILDMNQDGWNDIVVNDVSVLFNQEGSFAAQAAQFSMRYTNDHVVTDLDLDGLPDVVGVTSDATYVYRNR